MAVVTHVVVVATYLRKWFRSFEALSRTRANPVVNCHAKFGSPPPPPSLNYSTVCIWLCKYVSIIWIGEQSTHSCWWYPDCKKVFGNCLHLCYVVPACVFYISWYACTRLPSAVTVCQGVCHGKCKQNLPVPCVPVAPTPKRSKHVSGCVVGGPV